MKTFNQFIEIFKAELNEFKYIENHKELEKLHHFLLKYIQIAEFAYPKELNQLLVACNQCPTTIEQIKQKVQPIQDKYKIDISVKGILLEHDNKKQKFPLMDLRDFILNYIHPREDEIFYLILGWLLREDHFKAIQLFGIIMQLKVNGG